MSNFEIVPPWTSHYLYFCLPELVIIQISAYLNYSKALRYTFFGEWKNSCSSNSCNFCYLIGWRQDDIKTVLFSSNIFGPYSKTCTCKVRSAWCRVSWGLTVAFTLVSFTVLQLLFELPIQIPVELLIKISKCEWNRIWTI